MGVCLSSPCPCREEDAILQSTASSASSNKQLVSKSDDFRNKHNGAKLKIDIFSPTNTAVTTPGSTFITPRDGPLSLKSVISMTSATLDTTNASSNRERPRQPSRFNFNTPCQPKDEILGSIIVEEDDLDGTSEYNDGASDIDNHETSQKRPPPPICLLYTSDAADE